MTENIDAIFQIQGQTVEELKAFIESMKAEKQSEYVRKIRELEEELNHLKTSKKYGIVFEEKREDFEERARNALPVLQEVPSMRVSDDVKGPTNIVIEGDNYHALSCLRYTHKGKVDVIYIDPPYNTGNKDFIYNDRYVDKEDTYRHSKWLSFMKKRLVLAQELLSESGVIFISIDDNEQAQLKMLCDEVFGEGNLLGIISVINNLKGRSDDNFFATSNEYMLVFGKNIIESKINGFQLSDNELEEYSEEDEVGIFKLIDLRKTGKGWQREHRPFMFYPILFKENKIGTITDEEVEQIYIKEQRQFNDVFLVQLRNKYESEGYIFILPKDTLNIYGRWRWGFKTFRENLIHDNLVVKKTSDWKVFEKMRPGLGDIARTTTPKTIFYKSEYDTGSAGLYIKNIFGSEIFDNPKSVALLSDILKISSNKSSLILDFFAGSGTTGHAVLELNREDGGNRQFILCSNREATPEQPDKNICRDITYERVKRVATGYTNSKGESIPGLGGKIRYYQTDFIQIEKSRENLKKKFKLRCNELIQIKENTFEAITLQSPIPGLYLYRNHEQYTMLVYDYLYLDSARDILRSLDKKTSLYIFSISTGFSEDLEDLKHRVEVKHIPEELLEVYLRIFNF